MYFTTGENKKGLEKIFIENAASCSAERMYNARGIVCFIRDFLKFFENFVGYMRL